VGFGNVGLILAKTGDIELLSARVVEKSLIERADINYASTQASAVPGYSVTVLQSTVSTTNEDDFGLLRGPEASSTVQIVADVRFDNRDELCRSLGLPGADGLSDETLILRAYRRWGRDCASHLRGDFAFIIWDDERQLVLACRDPLGVRVLAYAQDGDRIVVASTVGSVVAALRERPRPNLDYLGKFLRGTDDWLPGPSAYQGVHWLPPAHQIEISGMSLRIVRYDEIRPRPFRRQRTEEVLAEFKALLSAAVDVRLRGKGPIGFMVSGGFDSSSILCLANEAVAGGRSQAQLRSYSAVFDRFKDSDDRPYLTYVLESCRHVTATLLPWDDQPWTLARIDGRDGFPLDHPPRGSRCFGPLFARRAELDGCRIMLSGMWADQLVLGAAYSFGRLLGDLPLGLMIHEAWSFFQEATPRSTIASIGAIGSLRLRRLAAALRLNDPPPRAPGSRIAQRFVHGRDAGLLVDAALINKWVATEFRMPFLDRGLQEFVRGLPAEFFFRDGFAKRLLREGLRDLLPPQFQQRRQFANASRFVFAAMKAEADEIATLLRAPRVVELGLVSSEVVRKLVDSLVLDRPRGQLPRLQRLLAVEIWLGAQG